MNLSLDIKTIVNEQLQSLIESLEADGDIRRCLSILPSIAYPLRGVLDISRDPSDMFSAMIVVQQLGLCQSIYDGKTEAWYRLNEDNIQELKTHMHVFALGLKEHITNDDEEGLVEDVKIFFSNFHRLARGTTQDTS